MNKAFPLDTTIIPTLGVHVPTVAGGTVPFPSLAYIVDSYHSFD